MNVLRILLIALLASGVLAGCRAEGERQTVRIGYLLCNSDQETRERFIPLTRYLSEKTGTNCIMVPVEAAEFEKRFAAGEFSFARTNSLIYVTLERLGARPVAGEKRGNFGSRTAGAIVARKGGSIRNMADLRGKSMAFGSIYAPAGYLAAYDLMLGAGFDPEKDLGHYTTPRGSFKHEKLVYGVLSGAYDAAAVPLLDLETMTREGKISADDLVIVAQSALIPYCTFVAAQNVPPDLARKFRDALTGLQQSDTVRIDGETLKVLKTAMVDGYEDVETSAYEALRGMARNVDRHRQLQ